MDLHHQREAGEHAEDMTSEPESVEYEDVPELGRFLGDVQNLGRQVGDNVPVRWGYVISSPRPRRKLAAHLANASGARALVPKYRLAPEVDATLSIGAHMQHVYPIYCGTMPEADAAVAMIGAWIRTHLP